MDSAIRDGHPRVLKLVLVVMDAVEVTSDIIKKVLAASDGVERFLQLAHVAQMRALWAVDDLDGLGGSE